MSSILEYKWAGIRHEYSVYKNKSQRPHTYTMLIPFQFPVRLLIAGTSGAGKTSFTAELIRKKDTAFAPVPERIIYCTRFKKSIPESILNLVEFHQGLPDAELLENGSLERVLIVIDDLQEEIFNSPQIVIAFQTSRHLNMGIIILVQNLFPKGRKVNSRDITLNCNYLCNFFSPRDTSSLLPLGRQLKPSNPTFLSQIFTNFTNSAYKYVLIDLTQDTPEFLRYRTNIFSPKGEIFVTEKGFQQFKNEEEGETSSPCAYNIIVP